MGDDVVQEGGPSEEGLFDEAAGWRAEATLALGLEGEERMAAVSPGAGFPSVLGWLAGRLGVGAGDHLVDVGAGLGGASAYLARHTGAAVVAVEPATGSARGAQRLFGPRHHGRRGRRRGEQLAVVTGSGTSLPLRSDSVDAVVVLGVLSLMDECGPLLRECRRVLRPGGRLGVSDLCLSPSARTVWRPEGSPNTFRSVGALGGEAGAAGLEVLDELRSLPATGLAWADVAEDVDAEVADRHQGQDGYLEWEQDAEQLARLVEAGALVAGTFIAHRPR